MTFIKFASLYVTAYSFVFDTYRHHYHWSPFLLLLETCICEDLVRISNTLTILRCLFLALISPKRMQGYLPIGQELLLPNHVICNS
jgi:hypothetical protein